MNNNDKFEYTYTAPTESERREIESIKRQYEAPPKQEDKLERLRRLNKRVTQPPLIIGLTLGIIGTLILGLGMTTVLEWNVIAWGVVIGVIGVAIVAVAYPIYKVMLKRNKQKYGKQIIDLSNELLNEQDE